MPKKKDRDVIQRRRRETIAVEKEVFPEKRSGLRKPVPSSVKSPEAKTPAKRRAKKPEPTNAFIELLESFTQTLSANLHVPFHDRTPSEEFLFGACREMSFDGMTIVAEAGYESFRLSIEITTLNKLHHQEILAGMIDGFKETP